MVAKVSTAELMMSAEEISDRLSIAGSEKILRYYISQGNDRIKGVSYKSRVPVKWQSEYMINNTQRISSAIDLTFERVCTPNSADYRFYISPVPQQDMLSGRNLIISHQSGKDSPLHEEPNADLVKHKSYERKTQKNIFLHELGHILGLEHPWDIDDGDFAVNAWSDSYESTRMGYNEHLDGDHEWYSDADVKALQSIWGIAPTPEPAPDPVPTSTEEDSNNLVQSIDDIQTPQQVSNFELKVPIAFGDQSVVDLIIGTKEKDKITGSTAYEVLTGGAGKDVLKGGGGSDGFLFNTKGFGKKNSDKILDFNPDEDDSILVDKKVFEVGKKVSLKSVSGKKALKKAFASNKEFIYDEKKGFLYYNKNGKEKGCGDGGLFVKLQGSPELGTMDFTII